MTIKNFLIRNIDGNAKNSELFLKALTGQKSHFLKYFWRNKTEYHNFNAKTLHFIANYYCKNLSSNQIVQVEKS